MTEGYLVCFAVVLMVLWIAGVMISGDIFSPVSIFCLMFLFSSFCAQYSSDNWNFIMGAETFRVLLIGVLSFFIPSVLFRMLTKRKQEYLLEEGILSCIDEDSFCPECKVIEISSNKALLTVIVIAVCSAVYLFFLNNAVGGESISRIASAYRNSLVDGTGKQIPFIGRLMMLLVRAIANVLVCVVINNVLATRNFRNKSIILLLCCLEYIVITLLSGERTSTLRFIGIIVLSFSILWQRNNYYRRLVNIKYVIISILGTTLLLYAFSAIRHFVGRSSQLDIFDYISMYAGGPIYSFNSFVTSYTEPTFQGTRTFIGLLNNLSRLGIGELASIHRDTVVIKKLGIYIGNVYTSFYDYYYDYGVIGMVLLVSSYSCFINALYNRAKYAENRVVLKTIEYTFFSTTLFFVSFTEQFYSSYVTISTFEFLIFARIAYCYLISTNVGFMKYKIPYE